MNKVIDVIVRKNGEKTILNSEGNLSVSISSPSIIQIRGSAGDVAHYVRQGKDLLIYMKDGTVIRCNNYFVEDPDSKHHSELVFNDQQALTHINFAETGDTVGFATTELGAQAESIASIEPFIEQGRNLTDAQWGWLAGVATLGGGVLGALLGNRGHDSETKTKVIDKSKEVESATPTFMVTDNAGDKQGLLSAKQITDDNTPTFSGSGQPGATIQVKDSSGSTIASTMVGNDGKWTVLLPAQKDGEHTWSVVQIDGSKTTSAGSITLTVATSDASITLATTAGDNVINASEQSAGFMLSGVSKNLAQGTDLTVTLNGKAYAAEVGATGAWSVKVPPADAEALSNGNWTVSVSGTDAAGNIISSTQNLKVDNQPPALSVDTIAQDNVINAAEHEQALTLSGTTIAEAGQTVTLALNGKNYSATVDSNGKWSVSLTPDDVKALAKGTHTLTASVNDKAGNPVSTTVDFNVDTTAPVVTIDTVSGDNVLNITEQGQAQIITGQAKGAAAGDIVTLTLGEQNYTGLVQADGNWSIGVPASAIAALGEGNHTLAASVNDAAGNTGSITHTITLNAAPPEFTIDAISQDNVLNAMESLQPLSVSGTSSLPDASTIIVTLNGVNYESTVENGVWSVVVPVSDVQNLANSLYTVNVSGTDIVGNSGSAEANLLVDNTLPQVIINTFAGDNLVNNAEAGVDQTLSGRVTGAVAGDIVSISVGGKSYTATVDSDLTWSVTIPSADLIAFGDGDLTFTTSVTNAHGNTGIGERDININAELPGLRVNTISGDDVVNAIEQQQDLTITGSSTHLAQGTQIIVTINSIDYPTVVAENGNWQIGVSAADLQNWTAGEIAVTASAEDAWGNTVSVEHSIELDLNPVAVTIDAVSNDDMLNAAEKGADLVLSGLTQGVEAGQTVVVKFADQTFTAQVDENGAWNLTVPASAMDGLTDGRAQISVSVTNVHGNSAGSARVIMVDTLAPTLFIDSLTDDDIINAAEAQQDLALSGSSNAEPGQTISVNLNGKQYQTTVQKDGTWQLNVPAADMGALADGSVTVTASVSDVAGNASSVDRTGLVDATVPQVTIHDFVTNTNTVNLVAHGQAQVLSGSVTGAAAGDRVTVTINETDYTTVVDTQGNWSLGLTASVVQGLADGTWTVDVSITDVSGNTGSNSLDIVVNTSVPEIAINNIAIDDVINATEKGEDLLLAGISNQPEGTAITVVLNGLSYTATTDVSGNWSVTVPAAAVSALGEANYSVTAGVTDSVGNSASATHDVLVDSSLPVVTINMLAGDNIVNAAEVAEGQTLTGQVVNAAAGDIVTLIIGGQIYTATVQDDLTWSLPLSADVLTAFGNGDLTASATVTNVHGNTGNSSLDFNIDAQLPGLRIDTVAGDDVINIIEHGQNLVITGTSNDLSPGSTITVTINGNDYPASVKDDGTWSAAVPAADVSQWADGVLSISASAQDISGNPVTIGTIVDVDLAPIAISINSVTDDNVLNAAEKGVDLILSGATAGLEAGQPVTVLFGGKSYLATVDDNGNWNITVPSADLANLKDGDASVQASVTNVNGNSVSAGHDYSVDATAPALTINTVSNDNMLNAAEAAADLTLSGTSSAEAGQTVTVTFNGNQYSAQVQADGSWTLDVPAADMAGIADGNAAITASVNDKAGNPATIDHTLMVDATAPVVTINTVAGDDVINTTEYEQIQIISGYAIGAVAGEIVSITISNQDYSTTFTTVLDAAGNWSLGVMPRDAGMYGDVTISATVTDNAGNSATASHDIAVYIDSPRITVDPMAQDHVINAIEKGEDLLISGTSSMPAGSRIVVSLNGGSYDTTTDEDGNWSVTVPATQVSWLNEGNYSVTVMGTDLIGNSGSALSQLVVDSTLPSVTINTIAGDDVINAAEVAAGQTISGRVVNAEAGSTVTVTLGDNEYTTTVQADLSWSVNVPETVLTALGNGDLTVTATVTNGVGNTGSGERDIAIDVTLPGLRVDTVAGDDVINSIEHAQNLIVSGTSDGLGQGTLLTVTMNGKTYTAAVQADGTWSAAVPAADVSALTAGNLVVTVAGQSSAGNPVSISHDMTVNLANVTIGIDAIATDDVINAAEKGQDLVLSGTTSNVEEGQTVTVIFAGQSYTATVDANGNWTTTVPSVGLTNLNDGDASVQASVTNGNGNSASAGRDYSVDATPPTVIVNTIALDDVLNAQEAQADLNISGISTAEAGQAITVTLNGVDYSTTVAGNGSWNVTIPATDLAALTDGSVTVTVSVNDKAGNPTTVEHSLMVDVTAPVVTINTVAGDDVINVTEHAQAQIVSGSATGAAVGDKVTVMIGGQSYTTVLDAAGNWSVGVPAGAISALQDGTVTVTVSVTDAAGNTGTGAHDVLVDTGLPSVSISIIATDDVINAAEKGQNLVLSGTTANVEVGQALTVTFGSKAYATTVGADGNWTMNVPASDMTSLKDGVASVQASVTNVNGNSASVEREFIVDATAPVITIDTIAGDNVINSTEAGAGVAISGTTDAEAGQALTVTLNGKTYTVLVQQGGLWGVNVPAVDLGAMADNGYTVQVSVSDSAGNPGSASKAITLDTTPPTVLFNTVAGDDFINSMEHAQAQIISGITMGTTEGDKLVVTLGTNQYNTTVDAIGNWSVGIPASDISALSDGTVTINATVTDSAGNVSTQTYDIVVNTAAVTLSVNAISTDDLINAAEANSALAISGSSTLFASGTRVTVTLNDKSYTAVIQGNGSWITTVPAADVAALTDGVTYPVAVSAQDAAGNSASATRSLSVDTTAPVISISTLSRDDVLNAAEAQQPLTVQGSSSAEAGQIVTVTLGGKSYTAIVGSNGTWTLDVSASDLATLSQGALAVTASVNDKAGNNGQTTHALTVDTLAPTVTIDTVADDNIVNNTEQLAGQTISGTTTAEQGQTVTVTFNGHSYQATVGADGTWFIFVAGRDFLGLSDGDYTITATVNDKAGNPGNTTHDVTLKGDVPFISINTFAEDDIVNAAEHGTSLIISGTTDATAGQTVTITLNGKTYTTTVQNDGTWSTTLGSADVSALADGAAYVINAQVSNTIGNSSNTDHAINVDLTPPAMGISIDSLQNDTGLSASDFITNDAQVVVNGSLTAQLGNNEKAQISVDGGVTWIDLMVTGTNWRYTDGRTLTDGTSQYQVRVIDNAGNVGATDSQDVVLDMTLPLATTITVDSVTQDTGLSSTDFITSDNQISLQGTLGAALGNGDHVQISLDGGVTWIDVSVSGLNWTYVDGRTLADGDHNYQLRVIDVAGNVSATTSQIVTIDTVVPDASKVISIDSISDDTGLSNSDFITNDTSLTVNGSLGATLSAGEYAQISIDGGLTWQNVNVTGNSWFYVDVRTLTDGDYNYYVRVVDDAGNVGSNMQQQVTVDTVSPDAAITVSVDSIAVDSGFDNNDFLTNSTSYTLNGTLGALLGAGEFVQVSMDGGVTWVYATVNGKLWSYNDERTLTDGSHNYQVRVIDEAGNLGATTSQTVTVDTQAPKYGITIDSISDDTGQSGSDFITMDTTLTLDGSLGSQLASDERVQISLDGGNTWIDTAVNNLRWSYVDTRELADGDYTYQVRIIDQAGNVGSTSSQIVTVDTTVPATVGTVVSYSDSQGERQGTFSITLPSDETAPVISGTLNRTPDDGDLIQLYRDGIMLGSVTMNGNASWSFQDSGLIDGNHTYVLRVTDKAGNYTESDGFVMVVDTTVPTTVATIASQTTSDTTPILNGTVSADLVNGQYVEVKVNGITYTSQSGGGVVVDPNNNTWYLQIPDSDSLAVASYTMSAQVKSSAGNGNNTGAVSTDLVIDALAAANTVWATTAGTSDNETMTVGLNSSGLWTLIANGQAYSSSDVSTYSAKALTNTRNNNVLSTTAADFDRNSTMDVFGTENNYANNTQIMWTNNGTSYTGAQLSTGLAIWYGGIIAYDKTGDGYLDLAYGDSGMDSVTYLVNNKGVMGLDGTNGEAGFTFDSGREISGVDLNNDGTVDIVQHTNRSSAYTLTVINNSGTGTLAVGQNMTNVFVGNASDTVTAASMTWADFNGDGFMDLYLGTSYNNNGGVIYYNDGAGQLLTSKSAVEASNASAGYLSVAVDWNADGQMDIVKLSTYSGSQTATLFTNNSNGSSWAASQLASALVNVTGAATVDYNWDGAQDLLVSQQNGKIVLVQNTKTVADGTAMHLHIVDSEGLNTYYGNTVNLYNSSGVLVASQIINAQSGIGSNDTSAMVSFYGLNASETYSAQILKFTNGVSDNMTWDGLEAGNGKEGYILTAEAATGGNEGTLTGTGYNDTFIAEDGTYTYNGSGGWSTTSDYDTWSTTGGMDIVDYRNATSGVTVDLQLTSEQETGFGTTQLQNIEGLAGSDYNDVLTGNSGDNQFEGRGGNDTFNIGSGGHDTLLYKLINASDSTGGNGSDVVKGFTVGTWEGTADTDRIDLHELLSDTGYSGSGSAGYVNGVATLDSNAGNITDYIRVVQSGSNTEIQIDRDGTGSQFDPTAVVTLNGVQTDLATLLANHQLLLS